MKPLLKKVLYSDKLLLLAVVLFFTLAFLLDRYVVRKSSADYFTLRIQNKIQKLERDFELLAKDTIQIAQLANKQYSRQQLARLLDEERGYAFFLYAIPEGKQSQLLFWNSQRVPPPETISLQPEPVRLQLLKNGYYIAKSARIEFNGMHYLLNAYIPVLHKYFVELENLQTTFDGFPAALKHVTLSTAVSDYPVKSTAGFTLFYLQPVGNQEQQPVWLIYFFIGLGLLFLLRFIQLIAAAVAVRQGPFWGIGLLLACLVLIRLLVYLNPSLLRLRQFELFDPGIYGTSAWLSSLGDLAINVFLFLWVALFTNRRLRSYPFTVPSHSGLRWLVIILLMGVLVLMTFAFSTILQSLVSDAQISFNVTNFFSLSRYSLIGFIVLAALAVGYFLITLVAIRVIQMYAGGQPFYLYLLTAAIGLGFLTFSKNTALIELNLLVLVWLMGFIFLMGRNLKAIARLQWNVQRVLFWLFYFSVSMAAVIIVENRKIEQEQRRLFAERLAQQAEPANERLLSIALTYLDNDFLAPIFDRFKDRNANARIKDSIINKNFSAYLNMFDTRIYTFDGSVNPNPLYNEDPVSFDTLNTIFNVLGKKTNISDLHYFERSFDKYAYISRKQIFGPSDSVVIGYVFLLAEPRRYKKDALVPALFRQSRESLLPEFSGLYSYAIYSGGELIDHFNEYEFPTHLNPQQLPRTEFETRRRDNYVELWYRKTRDNVVIIARKDNYYLEAITLFAYFFTTFLLLIVLYAFLRLLLQSRFRWDYFRNLLRLNIRNQIHGTIIVVSLFSFAIIGTSTILFYVNRYNANTQERLSRTLQIIVNQVQNKLKEEQVFQQGLNTNQETVRESLEQLMLETSEIHGTDVNLYDTLGRLLVTSRPIVYSKGVLGPLMNPQAWYSMRQLDAIQTLTEEHMGKINYLSIYNPLRNADGDVLAYLNVPSYSTQGELKQEISNFLVTLINLNAFIFLVAGAIALFITNRITYSFTVIGQKMRNINLSKMNQEIEWNRNDEIGDLVKEYNKMVLKLDESAAVLAKSERESAWRQMARQVAHEIKNPLTPMKLSIQYLEKAIDHNSGNIKEMTANVAKTLVEQIDHLSKIASDFSQFANIGNPHNEIFDIHDVLYSLSLLYGATQHLDFEWKPVHQRVIVFADKTQINRLFTNLLQNAVEATVDQPERRVCLEEELDGSFIKIKVIDNGEGIPENTRAKIFTPNFTTKSSGTGLGLAMCKSIVENAQGTIGFETQEGAGTTFFVKIPMFT